MSDFTPKQSIGSSTQRRVAEQLLEEREFLPDNWRLAIKDVDDLAIFQGVLRKALHLVLLVEAYRDDLAVDLFRIKEGAALSDRCNVIITIALEVDGGCCRR